MLILAEDRIQWSFAFASPVLESRWEGQGCNRLRRGASVRGLPIRCFKSNLCDLQNNPFFRIVAADKKSPAQGRHIEILGHYDPNPSESGRPTTFRCVPTQRRLVELAVISFEVSHCFGDCFSRLHSADQCLSLSNLHPGLRHTLCLTYCLLLALQKWMEMCMSVSM